MRPRRVPAEELALLLGLEAGNLSDRCIMSIEKPKLDDLKIDRSGGGMEVPWGALITVVVVLLLAGGGFLYWRKQAAIPVVRTALVSEETKSSGNTVLNASGYVTARREATVSSKVTGQVTEVLFDEGQKVEQGQVLARVDPSNLETSLRQAEAQLEVSKVALDETQELMDQAERELKRIRSLASNNIASSSDLDQAQSNFSSLRARLARMKVEVTAADRQVGVWKQQLDDTVIRAPFSGVIISKAAQPGEIISPMSAGGGFTRTGIGTIVDMASLEIEVDVNENYINRVEPGQKVEAVLDAYTDWKIPAKVIAIIPTADRQKATVKVRIGFDKLDPRILPDMGVKVSFQGATEVATAPRGITVPKAAVRNNGGQDMVLVLAEGKLERRAVKLGLERNDEVAVLSNLKGGERVVVEGPETLKDGDRVKEKANE